MDTVGPENESPEEVPRMKRTLVTCGLAAAIALGAAPSVAGEFDKAIKARKALMQVYAWNIGMLGAMAKGKMPYDADQAQAAANNLLAAVSMKNGPMWPKGSGTSQTLG